MGIHAGITLLFQLGSDFLDIGGPFGKLKRPLNDVCRLGHVAPLSNWLCSAPFELSRLVREINAAAPEYRSASHPRSEPHSLLPVSDAPFANNRRRPPLPFAGKRYIAGEDS